MEFERHPEFKYVLGEIWDAGSEYWLQISDVYKYGWDWNLNMMEDEGPIELMLRIRDAKKYTIVNEGSLRFSFKEDELGIILQWDDCFEPFFKLNQI